MDSETIARINKEIQLHGNTNLITTSGLPDNRQIHAIGDSHAIFFYNSLTILEHWGFEHRIPITMYKLINTPLNLYDVGALLGNGHEKYPIRRGDFVLFSYGYNDFQRRVIEHNKNEITTEIISETAYNNISTMLDSYIEKIKNFRTQYGIIPVVNCIYPNPREYAQGVNTVNTPVIRSIITRYANLYIADKCYQNDIMFFDIFNMISDDGGYIKSEYTIDGIHLNYNDFELRVMIDDLLVEKCKKYLESRDGINPT
jgi:hypothetical protein